MFLLAHGRPTFVKVRRWNAQATGAPRKRRRTNRGARIVRRADRIGIGGCRGGGRCDGRAGRSTRRRGCSTPAAASSTFRNDARRGVRSALRASSSVSPAGFTDAEARLERAVQGLRNTADAARRVRPNALPRRRENCSMRPHAGWTAPRGWPRSPSGWTMLPAGCSSPRRPAPFP
jgi:hypothetical protein